MTTEQPRAVRSTLRDLGARYRLPRTALDKLAVLQDLLAREPSAPTAIRDPLKVVDDHLGDALVSLECEQVRDALAIADLGSGPGIPGLPLAIALPGARVALVESNARKCAFIAVAIDSCDIPNAQVVHTRVESWRAGVGKMDLVTARALAPLPVVAEYAAPLLRVGGCVVVWRGGPDPDDEAAAARAADELGLQVAEPRQVHPYEGAVSRYLHLMLKVRPTPGRFPRRPGMARKRPLGSPPRGRQVTNHGPPDGQSDREGR